MAKDIIDEKIENKEAIKEDIINKQVRELKKLLESERYNIDTMLQDGKFSGVYHDLIDSKDLMNSKVQSNYNKTQHAIDIETYKLNKKIDNKMRYVDYEVNNKIKKIELKLEKMF